MHLHVLIILVQVCTTGDDLVIVFLVICTKPPPAAVVLVIIEARWPSRVYQGAHAPQTDGVSSTITMARLTHGEARRRLHP